MSEPFVTTGACQRRALLQAVPALALGSGAAPAWAIDEGVQRRWRFCGKCGVMHFEGQRSAGRCAADGGPHRPIGHLFKLHHSAARRATPPLARQYDWRFCGRCHGLHFDAARNKGRCPAGGGHAAAGFNFGLAHKTAGAPGQDAWRFCGKCSALFFDGAPNKGRCAGGGGHQSAGIVFAIPFDVAAETPLAVRAQYALLDAAESALVHRRAEINHQIAQALGQGDLIAPGWTLYNINFTLGETSVGFAAPTRFEVTARRSRLYCKSTQPSPVGSEGDPAFEVHFDCLLSGSLTLPAAPGARARAQVESAQVPWLEIKPRNVVAGVATTLLALFQVRASGRMSLQNAVRNGIEPKIAAAVNDALARA